MYNAHGYRGGDGLKLKPILLKFEEVRRVRIIIFLLNGRRPLLFCILPPKNVQEFVEIFIKERDEEKKIK